MTLPALNMVGWSIGDYETAFNGLNEMIEGCVQTINDARAIGPDGNFIAGARYVEGLLHGLDRYVEELATQLRSMRFPSLGDDDRRLKILLDIESQSSDFSLAEFCRRV